MPRRLSDAERAERERVRAERKRTREEREREREERWRAAQEEYRPRIPPALNVGELIPRDGDPATLGHRGAGFMRWHSSLSDTNAPLSPAEPSCYFYDLGSILAYFGDDRSPMGMHNALQREKEYYGVPVRLVDGVWQRDPDTKRYWRVTKREGAHWEIAVFPATDAEVEDRKRRHWQIQQLLWGEPMRKLVKEELGIDISIEAATYRMLEYMQTLSPDERAAFVNRRLGRSQEA